MKGLGNYYKKNILTIAICSILCLGIVVSATGHTQNTYARATAAKGDITVEDAAAILHQHMRTNGIYANIGTADYVDYITDMLMFENDKELTKHPKFDAVRVYAANYLRECNNDDLSSINHILSAFGFGEGIPKTMRGKTINELIAISNDEFGDRGIKESTMLKNIQAFAKKNNLSEISAKDYNCYYQLIYNADSDLKFTMNGESVEYNPADYLVEVGDNGFLLDKKTLEVKGITKLYKIAKRDIAIDDIPFSI